MYGSAPACVVRSPSLSHVYALRPSAPSSLALAAAEYTEGHEAIELRSIQHEDRLTSPPLIRQVQVHTQILALTT